MANIDFITIEMVAMVLQGNDVYKSGGLIFKNTMIVYIVPQAPILDQG